MNLIQWIRPGLFVGLLCLAAATAQAAQTCPAGYSQTTPDSDFADAGSGTVRHIPTGLIWKRCAEGQTWDGSTCTGTAAAYTWEQAFTRATSVNNGDVGTQNAAQSDWRVPNQNELRSIAELGCQSPGINLIQFPATPASYFWSGSPIAAHSNSAWVVGFNDGDDGWTYRSDSYQVRLVRAGQSFYNFDALVTITATASPAAGGTASCAPNPVDPGSTSTCTATPNTGYHFTSWSGDCTGASCILTNVTAAKSVTAGFALNSYTITATASPAAGGTASCTPNLVDHGSSSTCTATPNADYTFTGWSGDCTGMSCILTNVTTTKSVTAGFVLNSYIITTTANPAAGGTVICSPNPVDHGSSSTCTATPSTGYTFTGWSGDCTGMSCSLSNVTAAKNVTAGFALNSYAITTVDNPPAGGTARCSPNPVDHGGTSICTATPNEGYSFTGWSGDCARMSCSLSNVTAAKSVTAVFVLNSYTITATASPVAGGTASCSPNLVNHGGTSTCMATPSVGYRFTGWSGDCTGMSCSLTNVTAAKSVTAGFALNIASGAPVCILSANPASVRKGQSSTLTAACTPAATSYSWQGGTCAGSTAESCTVMPATSTSYSVTGTNQSGTGNTAWVQVKTLSADLTPILMLLLD